MITNWKTKLKTSISLLLVLAWLAACTDSIAPQESCDFVMNSQQQRVSWKTSQKLKVGVREGIYDADYVRAIEQALLNWENALGYELFDFYGILPESQMGDMDIKILWIYDWEDDLSREQARTLIKWRGNNIYTASIGINEDDHNFFVDKARYGRVDLVALIVHEVGHALGLAHVDDVSSVMYPELATNFDERREPTEEDLAAITCEY
ncbi:MAG: matrixin family metalloprotease [Bdellovibrionota bacterium]|nr:matrixin family metalloprotease [Bdellovibrionota bacterium]